MASSRVRPVSTGRNVTSLSALQLASSLGPAEAQYGEQLAVGFTGPQGALGCGITVTDGDANDNCASDGCVGADYAWNDLSAETGYRTQFDYDSASFGGEDPTAGVEVAADTTTGFFNVSQFPGQRTHTLRILGHVGHAPGHGGAPIAGDVVSNECSITLVVPDIEPPA